MLAEQLAKAEMLVSNAHLILKVVNKNGVPCVYHRTFVNDDSEFTSSMARDFQDMIVKLLISYGYSNLYISNTFYKEDDSGITTKKFNSLKKVYATASIFPCKENPETLTFNVHFNNEYQIPCRQEILNHVQKYFGISPKF